MSERIVGRIECGSSAVEYVPPHLTPLQQAAVQIMAGSILGSGYDENPSGRHRYSLSMLIASKVSMAVDIAEAVLAECDRRQTAAAIPPPPISWEAFLQMLSTRTANALSAEIKNWSEFLRKTPGDLMELRGCGDATVAEVTQKAKEAGVKWGWVTP